jgi:hypothetical protein
MTFDKMTSRRMTINRLWFRLTRCSFLYKVDEPCHNSAKFLLRGILLSGIMLRVILPSVILEVGILPSVILTNVVAPSCRLAN